MTLLESATLGLIQGLTEFLPVSSSGHLVLAQHVFGLGGAENLTFDVLLHVATLTAVLVAFRADLAAMARGFLRDGRQTRLVLLILLAMVPTGIIALSIKGSIESVFENPIAVGFMLMVTGTFLFVAPRIRSPKKGIDGLRAREAVWIGIAQGFATLPGISRSGSTISTGIVSGIHAEAAARFSFLLAIPAILAAMVLNIPELGTFRAADLPAIAVGMGVAFLSGLFSIRWLMRIARRGRFDGFAVYCLLLGAATVAIFW